MTGISERRGALEDELAQLRKERGSAALDGKRFDASKISAAESELDGLREAEGMAAERARKEAEAEHRAQIAKLKKQLALIEDKRQRAIQDANSSCRALAESITKAINAAHDLSAVAHAITGGRVPQIFNTQDFVSRIAGRIAAVMRGIPNHRARLGHLHWKGPDFFKASDNWRDREAIVMEPYLKPLLEKEETDAKE